jgi:hypothetical protein
LRYERFAAANEGAAVTISAASSVDSGAMPTSAAATLGPIGASYLGSYAPALANNLAATRLVANVHAKIGDATLQSKVSINAAENAYAPIEPDSMGSGAWFLIAGDGVVEKALTSRAREGKPA